MEGKEEQKGFTESRESLSNKLSMEEKEQEITASGESLSNAQLATMINTLSKGFEEFKYKYESRPSRVQPEMAGE